MKETSTRARKDRLPADELATEGTLETVEGTLYALNLRTGQYRLEDDAGHSIFVQIELPTDDVRPLIDQRVRASGAIRHDSQGRPHLTAQELRSSEGVAGLDRDAFFASHELESLVATVEPLEALQGLAINDVSDDEADAFLIALRRGA